jgi:hypothetical protein
VLWDIGTFWLRSYHPLSPAQCWYVYGQRKPAPQGHSGYWSDPRVWATVDRMAATGPRIPIGSGTH